MQYPGLPNNRLVVGGVDLSTEYNLVLADGYVLEPPEPKTYTIDIPGADGLIDLTEYIYGDVTYNNRNQSFTFYVIKPDSFENVKKSVSNFLHGKEFDYTMTMDPSYTYHGRFSVTAYEHTMYEIGVVGTIKINISADPYKYKDPIIRSFNASGGIIVTLQSGRKRVSPTIEVDNSCVVIFDNNVYELTPGTWKINNLTLKEGSNVLYFNSNAIYNTTWQALNTNNITWGQLKNKPLYEWYKSISNSSSSSNNDPDDVYIKYEWGDL